MHRLSHVRRGSGPPLLLIQGMSGHHAMWGEDFLDQLAADFDVVAYDHRGIGTSERADEPFEVADLADDAAGLIAELGWSGAHVFGISLGGMVAQELVLRHPTLVRTQSIGCSWAGGPSGLMSETSRRIVAAIATRDAEHALRTGFEANFSAGYAAEPGRFERYAELALAVKVPARVVLMQFDAALRHDTTDRLAQVSAPTLVLHGTEDAGLVPANGERIADLVPGARLELVEGAGHLFWWEQPDLVLRLLREHAGASAPAR